MRALEPTQGYISDMSSQQSHNYLILSTLSLLLDTGKDLVP